jgi:PPOX class probable F420-dependent enzyme
MAELTDAQRAFIRDNPFYAVVTTLRADGSPHSTVVWVDEEDGKVLFNTAYPRVKSRELDGDPRASMTIVDPADGYRWVTVSGPVTLSIERGDADIDRLSYKYTGHEYRSHREGETRVTGLITPERITAVGV